ncbi:MAG: pyruvate kinase, partial [Clostridia bacterium]
MKKTKIVCTLGPSTTDEKTLEEMLRNGMNVARLNFSHGSHEYHKKMIDTFRKVRDKLGYPAALLLDTKGPEIRLKTFKDGEAFLNDGQTFTLTSNDIEGNTEAVSVTYPDLARQLKKGDKVLIDDGRIKLVVESTTETDIICTVINGGEISNRKGVNTPNIHLDMIYLSEADKKDLLFGIEEDVDFIAASFVRCKEDVISIRRFLDYNGGHGIKIISKIENIEGIENFDAILEHSDGIMVARGDMGVEVEYERLPGLQKTFIRKCYSKGKMVITATQMLESMIHNVTPTRAEITDVANAVFDGTSAVMLSGETAVGDHPPLVV